MTKKLSVADAKWNGVSDGLNDAADLVSKQPRDQHGRIDGDILWRELKMRSESAAKLAKASR